MQLLLIISYWVGWLVGVIEYLCISAVPLAQYLWLEASWALGCYQLMFQSSGASKRREKSVPTSGLDWFAFEKSTIYFCYKRGSQHVILYVITNRFQNSFFLFSWEKNLACMYIYIFSGERQQHKFILCILVTTRRDSPVDNRPSTN